MKKRILSIILAFAMIMTLIPQTVFAEAASASDGYLAYRYAHYDDVFFIDYEEPLHTSYSSEKYMTSDVYFFYVEGETETLISGSELYVSDETIANVMSFDDDEHVMLEPVDYGTTTINYERDGKTYSVPFEVTLQEFGFCSSPKLTTDSIIEEFSVAEPGDKFYFATKEGHQFDSVELLEKFDDIADAEISADKTYITITFNAIPENNEIYQIRASFSYDEEYSHETTYPITLFDGTPSLRYRFATWSEETQSFYGDPEESLNKEWTTEPDVTSPFIFYYVENGVETELDGEELAVSNPAVVELTYDAEEGAVFLGTLDFGYSTISYIKDGVEYSVDINVELPMAAFYSEPVVEEDLYIRKFIVTEDRDTFYYVAKDGWKITYFDVYGECIEYANVSLSEDNSYLAIEMDEDTENGYIYIDCQMEKGDDWDYQSSDIKIESGKPTLVYKYVWSEEDGYVAEEDYYHNFYATYDDGWSLGFYLKEGEKLTPVLVSDLEVANNNIVTFETIEGYENFVDVYAVGVGETEIRYTVNNITYAVPVTVEAPIMGAYSSPEGTLETLINEFDLTEETNEFYVVARDGWKITDCEFMYDFGDFAKATMSSDGTYVKVTVLDDIETAYHHMTISGYHEQYDEYTSFWVQVKINNNLPGLRFGHLYSSDDEILESDDLLLHTWMAEPGWRSFVGFYYHEDGVKTKVNSDELVIADENVVEIEPYDDDEHAVYMHALRCGETTISYTKNGKTYSVKVIVDLPEFGFYSSPNANEDAYLDKFVVYNERDTFYFVARNGWQLEDVRLQEELAEVAEVTIDPLSKTFATIKITKEIEDFHGYLVYDAINYELDDAIEDWGSGIFIENGAPDLKYKYGYLQDNGLIEVESSTYESVYWGEKGTTGHAYLYHVENGVGTRVTYDKVTSSDNSIVKVQKCDHDKHATELEFVGCGEAEIEYELNGETYSFTVVSELPGCGFFATTDFTEESFITEFGVTESNKTFYLMTSGDARFGEVKLVGDAAEYAEAKILQNTQIIEITIADDFAGEKNLELDVLVDVPLYDYSYENTYKIKVYNEDKTDVPGMEDPGVPDGVDYAPYYDAETQTVKGIKVGDEVKVGTVFSGNNLQEGQILAFGYKAFETDVIFRYSMLLDRGLYTVGEEGGNFDPADGWVVSSVGYNEWEDEIIIQMVSKVPPVQVKPINISVDWSQFVEFKIGETVPDTVEGISIAGEGVERTWPAEVKFSVREEHIEKGYITEEEYRTAIYDNGGWWYVGWVEDSFIASAGDEFAVRVDASSEIGYVFAYTDSEQITGNIILYTDDIVVLKASAYVGDYAGMAAAFDIKLGSIEKITEKANPVVILKGWQYIDGKWYFYDNAGQKVTNQWRKDSKGWCFLGEDGAMLTSQWVKDSKGYCFVDKSGYMVYNQWCLDDNGWAFAGTDGYRQTSKWIKDSAGWCYVDETGYMVYSEWIADSKGYVYVDDTGYMATNKWIETDDGWCYMGSDGYKATNQWVKKVGNWAYVGADGYLVTNDWAKDGSRWCYMDENGFMTKDQWINDGTGSCYMDANGYLVTNKWLTVDGEWVYVGNSGYMVVSAWAKDSKGWCYLDENGHMVCNDWVADSKGEVYLDASGYMVTNKWIAVEDKWCYVGSDGYKVTSQWRKDSKGWCYLGEDGFMLTNQWVKDSVGYCYVDEGGYIVYNQWVELDGNTYYVNASGYRVENSWLKLNGKEYYFKEGGVMARDEKIGNYYVDENGVWVPGQ